MSPSVPVGSRPGRIALLGIYLFFTAQVARTLTSPKLGAPSGEYVLLFALFIFLFTVILRLQIPPPLRHLYLLVQSAVTLALLSLNPEIDSITALFVLLTYHTALLFTGRTRWLWVTALALAIPTSIVVYLGPLRGLAAGFTPMAVAIVVPAIVAVNEEIESARIESERLVAELKGTHRQLESHASQAEEMAVLEERNRLARELHDSVSQTIFAVTLNARSAQRLLEQDRARGRAQLEQLQQLTQNALAQMRHLIAQMRP